MFKINSGRKQENGVWRYFSYDPSTDKSRCNVVVSTRGNEIDTDVRSNKDHVPVETCGQLLKGKNATNLVHHLNHKHKEVAKDLAVSETVRKQIKAKSKQIEITQGNTLHRGSVQAALPACFNSRREWSPDSQEVKLRERLLCSILISSGLSTSFMDNPDVREFFKATEPRFKVPGFGKMKTLLLDSMQRMAEAVQADILEARRLTIAADCWTKKGLTASFLAISAAFFHSTKHRAMHVLLNLHQIEHPHTGDMLAMKLNDTLDSWKINRSKVLAVITDNGSNMVKAVRVANIMKASDCHSEQNENEESDGSEDENLEPDSDSDGPQDFDDVDTTVADVVNLHRIPCIAHTLQLVMKELTKIQTYVDLVAKTRSIVHFVKGSSVTQEKLLNLTSLVLRRDCSTRWNSEVLMIERMLAVRNELEEILKEQKRDSLSITEWERLSSLERLFRPFKTETDHLQTDTLSLSNIIPSLLQLSLHLNDDTLSKVYAKPLLKSLQTRFSRFLDASSPDFDPLPAAACLVDPTVCELMYRSDMVHVLAAATQFIMNFVTRHRESEMSAIKVSPPVAPSSVSIQSPPRKRFKALFEDTTIHAMPSSTVSSLPEKINLELSAIRAASAEYDKIHGLDFWTTSGVEKRYPILVEMAQDFISSPASQAYVERVFSVCGELTSGKRNRLTKNLEMRTFMKVNKKFY